MVDRLARGVGQDVDGHRRPLCALSLCVISLTKNSFRSLQQGILRNAFIECIHIFNWHFKKQMNLNILCFLNNNNRSELCGNCQIVDLVCSFRVFIKENKVLKNTSYENC